MHYACDCGVKGRCMIKPMSEEGTIVLDIRCPICSCAQRVKITQTESDELAWACILYNEITDYDLREEL